MYTKKLTNQPVIKLKLLYLYEIIITNNKFLHNLISLGGNKYIKIRTGHQYFYYHMRLKIPED